MAKPETPPKGLANTRTGRRVTAALGLGLIIGLAAPAAGSAQAAPRNRPPGSSGGSILEVNVTSDPARMHGQPQIAIDPKHPNHLVFMSTADDLSVADPTNPNFYRCFLAYSADSGTTWTQVPFPYGDAVGCGNPQLAVDSKGRCPPPRGRASATRSPCTTGSW
jgi:hypothetical protein